MGIGDDIKNIVEDLKGKVKEVVGKVINDKFIIVDGYVD